MVEKSTTDNTLVISSKDESTDSASLGQVAQASRSNSESSLTGAHFAANDRVSSSNNN